MEWKKVADGNWPPDSQLTLVKGTLCREVQPDNDEPSIGLVLWDNPNSSPVQDTDCYGMFYTDITEFIPIEE